jgi:uncharacterized radical SAM superfamily protein
MISGTYWEFFCPHCGYFVSIKLRSNEDDKKVKKQILDIEKKHLKKHKK